MYDIATVTHKEAIELGKRLKEYRLDRDWTLKQMGTAIGLVPSAVRAIENGFVIPQDRTVRRIQRSIPVLFEAEKAATA